VRTQGLNALSFSAVADDLKVTRTVPLYYFGSREGLLAAIAEYGFLELTFRLRRERESGDGSEGAIKQLGLTYADYALENAGLYRTMHAPDLWEAVTSHLYSQKHRDEAAAAKARAWIEKAISSRFAAFQEFMVAVKDAEAAGHLRKKPIGQIAHLVMAIVDGFLFHHFQEHVGTDWPTEARLAYLEGLLDCALSGLCVSL
jgi:AcrR family transcriptional regulator